MKIEWSAKSVKQLKKIQAKQRAVIAQSVHELHENLESNLNVKKLRNHHYDYRLRVGRYRVMFNVDRGVLIIEVMEVVKRDERTY